MAMGIKILQVTDSHIYCDPNKTSCAVPTRLAFEKVMEHVATNHADLDLLVLSGDLVNEDTVEGYRLLRDLISGFGSKFRLLPGNHDYPIPMREVFVDLINDEQFYFEENISDRQGDWHILGLNSRLEGEVGGRLGPSLLARLGQKLFQTTNPTIIFCHHHPYPIGDPHMDRYIMEDGSHLISLLGEHPQVKAVVFGHIHREFQKSIPRSSAEDLLLLGTPSTGVQLKSSLSITLDHISPGYRQFTLTGSCIDSEVIRLPEITYPAALEFR
jgi:3',5'-cyclic-AMP phosphodiesterase